MFDDGVTNIFSSYCLINAGYPLSKFYFVFFCHFFGFSNEFLHKTPCFGLCYLASTYIVILMESHPWMEGVAHFFLHFTRITVASGRRRLSDKTNCPLSSRGSQTLSRSSKKLKECAEMHSPLQTSPIRSPNYNNNPQHCHFGRAVICRRVPTGRRRLLLCVRSHKKKHTKKILADGFRASQGLRGCWEEMSNQVQQLDREPKGLS